MSKVEIGGWKTKVSAVLAAAIAGVQTYAAVTVPAGTANPDWVGQATGALAGLSAMFGVLGIGHKVEKAKVSEAQNTERLISLKKARLAEELKKE